MPGRKNPQPTENEKEHMYHAYERREKGEKIQGDAAEDLPYRGEMGDVRRKQDEWAKEHGRQE